MKLNNNKLPLRIYLSCAFLSFSIVLIIIMWLFQSVFFDDFYRTIKTIQVDKCATSVSKNIENADTLKMLNEIEKQNSMDVSVYNTSTAIFTPIYTPNNFSSTQSLMNINGIYQYYQQAYENGGKVTVKNENPYDIPSLNNPTFTPPLEKNQTQRLTCAVITNTENAQYLVIVESDISPITSIIDTLQVQLVIITIIILIISIFIAIITAHYLSKPIHDTTKKAKLLSKQNYNLTFSGGNYKELCELNDTLTYSAQELQKVDSLRRELIANISHDLRTPLTMITGYSEVMRDIPGENTPENIQIIIDESTRLSTLVSDLLDISKLESGSVVMHNTVFNLTDCIKDIFKRYTKLIEVDNFNIIFEYSEDVYVNADPLRISQVMYNLINNAINYCGVDKTVIVRQTIQNNFVRIDVIDHGDGIEQDKLDYIWDRYYKVDKEHKQAKVGTGLGLSIVKNILNQYNAQYGVNSAIGQGSDFWWMLELENHNDNNN